MIRTSNINVGAHTADFKCDEHGGSVTRLNLNTNTQYGIKNDGSGDPDTDFIFIQGSELTAPCSCVSGYPTFDKGNELGHELGQAKTA